MSTKYVPSILGASNRVPQTETAHEMFEEVAFELNPTKVGVPRAATTIVGPPDSGAHLLGELWTDALCARWRCTVAGTVGTWLQITPAIVATADRPTAPPDGYWILDTDEHFKGYYYDLGGTAWVAV
jgi:hypothetical protein